MDFDEWFTQYNALHQCPNWAAELSAEEIWKAAQAALRQELAKKDSDNA